MDYKELKKLEIINKYSNCLKEGFTNMEYIQKEEHQWKDVATMITQAAIDTIPGIKKDKVNNWYDTD